MDMKDKYKLCVAPMMGHTDRHFRFLLRMISKKSMLYTEMVAANSIMYKKDSHSKLMHSNEKPVGFQIAGDEPKTLADSVKIINKYDYDEINLNIGCPSKRAQAGGFGACQFDNPELVATAVREISKVTNLPISVKTRLGLNNNSNYNDLYNFINVVSNENVKVFHIHARNAILKGINPRKNRSIPQINYEWVYRIKEDYPSLIIIINGEISLIKDIILHLDKVDGVMIGREVCNNPFILNDIERLIYPETKVSNKQDIVKLYLEYIINNINKYEKITDFTKHLACFFKGTIGSKHTRAYMCHEIKYEKNPIRKLEELINKEAVWQQDGLESNIKVM